MPYLLEEGCDGLLRRGNTTGHARQPDSVAARVATAARVLGIRTLLGLVGAVRTHSPWPPSCQQPRATWRAHGRSRVELSEPGK